MKRQDTIIWSLLAILLSIAMFGLAGCSSDDPVSPNEEIELTAEDVAHQSGLITYAMAEVLQNFTKAETTVQMFTPLTGFYQRNDDGADVRYYTLADQELIWTPAAFGEEIAITFDVTLSGGTPKAANGSGALHAGTLAITFDLDEVQLDVNHAPVAGTIIVSSGRFAASITFGVGTATVQIGTETWTIDMTDGSVS